MQHLAFREVLSALWQYAGWIDTLRQAKGFAHDHRQVSHEWLGRKEDCIVCIPSHPELAQRHLIVFVPVQESETHVYVP